MTQKARVLRKLKEDGEITNLWAIENHILRLGAIIHTLRQEGWEIDSRLPKDKNCVYTMKRVENPYKVHVIVRDGRPVAVRDYKTFTVSE